MVEVHGDGRAASAEKEEDKQPAEANAPDQNLAKHLLQNNWTWWFFRNDRSKQWEENQAEVAGFGTVEDFWALYNHVESAGTLPAGCDYRLVSSIRSDSEIGVNE
jgi:translation initiation factor 4E